MKKKVLIWIFVLFSVTLFANDLTLKVNGTLKYDGHPLTEVKIEVYNQNKIYSAIVADAKGKFKMDLPGNNLFTIVISKNGFYTQHLKFDTHIEGESDGKWYYKFSSELYPTISQISQNQYNKIQAIISYNHKTDEFLNTFSNDYCFEIKNFLYIYHTYKLFEYKRLIVQADSLFERKEYKAAKQLYSTSALINEYDIYPDLQIDMADYFINLDKKTDEKYNKTITIADELYTLKDYKKAKNYYIKANKLKPTDYSEQQISKIKNIVPLKEVLSAK